MDLVTAEPLGAPVAMAFDENGRLFVIEQPGYLDAGGRPPSAGLVRVLEDTDNDGKYDKNNVYASELSLPSAVACYDGGIFVAAGSEILYLKDSQGDGNADIRKVIFSGFGGTNIPGLVNNFNWGLDNRIHGGSGGNAGIIATPAAPGATAVSLGRSDFAFDPRTFAIWPQTGPAQFGLSFDDAGRKFLCQPGGRLQMVLVETRYLARNPYFPTPRPVAEVANPATTVFQLVTGQPTARTNALGRSVGSSRVDLQACKLEYSIVSPK